MDSNKVSGEVLTERTPHNLIGLGDRPELIPQLCCMLKIFARRCLLHLILNLYLNIRRIRFEILHQLCGNLVMFFFANPVNARCRALPNIPQEALPPCSYRSLEITVTTAADRINFLERIEGASKRPGVSEGAKIFDSLGLLLA
jgi:hypothetical protein